jgi:Fur family ferric uptake transcriptional regulator
MSVLALLKAAPSPLSHADIEAMLAKAGKKMDRVTLYRVLDWFSDHGLAHKAADARGVFRYSAAEPDGNHSAHGHFHCLACGGVYCLDVPAPRTPRLPHGFRLRRIALDIQGECARCSKARP